MTAPKTNGAFINWLDGTKTPIEEYVKRFVGGNKPKSIVIETALHEYKFDVDAELKISDVVEMAKPANGAASKFGTPFAFEEQVACLNNAKVEPIQPTSGASKIDDSLKGVTLEHGNKGEIVLEDAREYHHDSGQVSVLRNITRFEAGGSWTRVWHEGGFSLIDPSKLRYMSVPSRLGCGSIKEAKRKIVFTDGSQLNMRNVTDIDVTRKGLWIIRHDAGTAFVYSDKVDIVTIN